MAKSTGRPLAYACASSPVRVGRFEWERLMLLSPLPWPTRSVLLALAVFMSDDGGDARPGLDNLMRVTGRGRSVLIDHLTAAVHAGYLVVIERGGFRRRTARATEYAAAVPPEVYAERDSLLRSPPWRTPASDLPDVGGKDESPAGRTLVTDEGPVSGDEGPVLALRTSGGPDPTTHLHHASNTSSPSGGPTSPPEPPDPTPEEEEEILPNPQPQQPPDAAAAALVDQLPPVAGKTIRPRQRAEVVAAVAARLAAGWTPAALRAELTDNLGTARGAGVYLHRLQQQIDVTPPVPARPAPPAASPSRLRAVLDARDQVAVDLAARSARDELAALRARLPQGWRRPERVALLDGAAVCTAGHA